MRKNYVKNADLLSELAKCREIGNINPELAAMFDLMATRVGTDRRFNGYTFNDEMVRHAYVTCCLKWDKFDPTRGNNPFAYYSQAIFNCFRQQLNAEKKQYDIRDELLVMAEQNPSYNYGSRHNTEDE